MPTRGKSKPTSAGPRVTLSLALQFASASPALPSRAQLRRWVKAALGRSARITVRVVDPPEARALNKQFRGKDYATNVLTFVYDAASHVASAEAVLTGDIVLCAPVVEREAREQGKATQAHYAHLTVHGVLHLQGYDHERSREAKIMEQLEIDTLAKLGYADPYLLAEGLSARAERALAAHS
jgi:probable rRNA maturation factor